MTDKVLLYRSADPYTQAFLCRTELPTLAKFLLEVEFHDFKLDVSALHLPLLVLGKLKSKSMDLLLSTSWILITTSVMLLVYKTFHYAHTLLFIQLHIDAMRSN